MTTILSNITSLGTIAATWGPSAFYFVKGALNLLQPSNIKNRYGEGAQAIDLMPDLFEKVDGLRKDIAVYQVPHLPTAAVAIGTNFGPSAVILLNQEFSEKFDVRGACKHEISHIENSDVFKASTLAMVVATLSTFAIPYIQTWLPWWMTPLAYGVPYQVAINTFSTSMIIFELFADIFAVKYSDNDELINFERTINSLVVVNKSLHAKYPNLFTIDGNHSGDTDHPNLTTRLSLIRAECQKRWLFISENVQDEEFQRMKRFHLDIYRQFHNLEV